MNETCILIRLLWMYFPQNLKFGSVLSKLWNLGGGRFVFNLPPLGTPMIADGVVE
jgi:hypothetical protein